MSSPYQAGARTRGRDESPASGMAGDRLSGATPDALGRAAAEAVRDAAELERTNVGDFTVEHILACKDADGVTVGEALDKIGYRGSEKSGTRKLGAFKTSMLQDAEAGRPLELDALVGAVREIGVAVGEPTPAIDALLGLTRLSAKVREARAEKQAEM